ncbi:hypothetical protein D3C83_158140 [compost metagenome]
MDAVLSVDPEALFASLLHHLIDTRRTIALRRLGIFRQVDADGDGGIGELQMRRFVLAVMHP